MISTVFATLGLLAALVLAPASYRAEIEKYRRDRIAELTAPDGWLAVRGLFWLHEGANTAGSDPASEIRLPSRTAKRLGVFTLAQGQISFAAEPGASVTADGKPITTYTFGRGAESSITTAGVSLAAIRRGDKIGLRMRDPESPNRTGFKGLKHFPLNPAYRVRAKFTAYEKPKLVPVPNVLGQLVSMESPGYVEFNIQGKPYRLEPVYETSRQEDLFFIFKDLTSRTETYEAGRFLHTALPHNGIVDLDFNRAYNPPCAFTEFATCPLPIKENKLQVRIQAGELNFHLPV
ncbi:MAG TPA: DUF1684 domain-containing protein, partial [Vicinamibacterales bacterium]